ncbi:hypothetical protein CC78DRAFT_461857, partial [Lojkania enalia]
LILATRMFKLVLVVATGAGIRSVLSLLHSIINPSLSRTIKVFWCAHALVRMFGI